MGFHTTKEIQENGKTVVEIRYWGFWLDLRFMIADFEQVMQSGKEVRQYLNGRLFQNS